MEQELEAQYTNRTNEIDQELEIKEYELEDAMEKRKAEE